MAKRITRGACVPEHCTSKIITWEKLVAHEPRLDDVLKDARSIKNQGDQYFCKDYAWTTGWKHLAGFKQRIYPLIGFGSCHRNSFLATSQAWDVALETILEALPPCRHCGCCIDSAGNFAP